MQPSAEPTPPSGKTYRLPNGLPVYYLSKTDTDLVYQEIFAEDVYRLHGVTFRDGDCIFDVGANSGLFILFLNQICASARVFAIEPIPAVFDVMRRNVELHNKLDVTLLNVGLSRVPGTATFTYYPRISCASTMYPDDSADEERRARQYILKQIDEHPLRPLAWLVGCSPRFVRYGLAGMVRRYFAKRQRIHCPLTTISELIRQHHVERIDFLKLDAERAELDILAGIDEADWPKIRQTVIEVHDGPKAAEQIQLQLGDRGFSVAKEHNPHFSNIYMLYGVQNDAL